jgi:putative MATE family efflux protein
MRSVQTVKIGFFISVSALLINVFLNYIFIYGNLGAPEMGVRGAAIATLISRIVEACIITVYVFRIDKKVKLAFRTIVGKANKVQLGQFVKIAFPVMLGNVSWGIAMTVQIGFVGHLGTAVIAAYSIATTVFQIVSVVEYGAAAAANVVIAKTIGEKDIPRVKLYSRCIQVIFVLTGIASGIVMFFFRGFVIQAYDISPAAQALALDFMLIMSLELVGTAYQMAVITGIIRGGGDTKFAFFNDFLFMWCLILPLSGLAAFVWNLPPVWVFFILKSDQLLKCIPAALRVNGNRWIKKFPEEAREKAACPACAADQNSS